MTGLLLRRFRDLIIILLVVGTMMFLIIRLVPGDPAVAILGANAQPQELANLRQALGLDGALYEQYLAWLGQVVTGNLGESITHNAPVLTVIGQHIGPTLTLAVISTAISFCIAVAITTWYAVRPRSPLARLVNQSAPLGMAIPDFWMSLILILVFALTLRWLPTSGYTSLFSDPAAAVQSLVLPVAVLVIAQSALFTLTLRESVLGELTQMYLRTARIKGLTETQVVLRHVLPNALMPILTIVGTNFAVLIGGIVIIESIFVIPGLGSLLLGAIHTRDFPLIQGITLFIALLFVAVNLLVDLSYALIDPKVRVS
ncbi:ABC transporter permease [Actinobacteria bacterium YIM 96077]|uniref:ABC transporter permease n=1 Tax=Phytoactinopolyspora halophila TaxID=1981511 RepID=A0A329QMJ0_9ACTN|nr:ABC transporter permease [Phytoactinopolyspora halophila]AYY12524.1 ABC transporter permease [Actinobacteria bacterium YIM 96077]RAW12572.1 ABC transporter permease [Phytoactinopolyspora halophila]